MIGVRFLCLMLLPVAAGLMIGLTGRPTAARVGLRPSVVALVLAAVALQILRTTILPVAVAGSASTSRAFGLIDLCIAVLLLWLNREALRSLALRWGLGLTALGIGLNAIPVVLVGAMPISQSAALRAGVPRDLVFPPTRGYVGSTEVATWIRPLGDWMAVPGLEKVLSPGDLLLFVGLAIVVGVVLRWALRPGGTGQSPQVSTSAGGRER